MAGVISFNGVTYNSVEEMPPDVRRAYEQVMGMFDDQNRDGVPDMFEGLVKPGGRTPQVHTTSTVILDGKVVAGDADLPPMMRQRLEKVLDALDADDNGLADMIEAQQTAAATPKLYGEPALAPSMRMAPTVVSPEGGDRRLLWLGVGLGALAVLACGAAALALLWVFTR